ncbi:hypothetical protein H0H81_000784 [Sphagnurus paluster]|uniref:Uncharacterized protein n=1 Tax=Sphagnurus paluster TaxID=117069 RepID=A0A9P7GML7_9AGAR|nr:hypothetical protein H0H81_000784 [Sphagnurus paluster]
MGLFNSNGRIPWDKLEVFEDITKYEKIEDNSLLIWSHMIFTQLVVHDADESQLSVARFHVDLTSTNPLFLNQMKSEHKLNPGVDTLGIHFHTHTQTPSNVPIPKPSRYLEKFEFSRLTRLELAADDHCGADLELFIQFQSLHHLKSLSLSNMTVLVPLVSLLELHNLEELYLDLRESSPIPVLIDLAGGATNQNLAEPLGISQAASDQSEIKLPCGIMKSLMICLQIPDSNSFTDFSTLYVELISQTNLQLRSRGHRLRNSTLNLYDERHNEDTGIAHDLAKTITEGLHMKRSTYTDYVGLLGDLWADDSEREDEERLSLYRWKAVLVEGKQQLEAAWWRRKE